MRRGAGRGRPPRKPHPTPTFRIGSKGRKENWTIRLMRILGVLVAVGLLCLLYLGTASAQPAQSFTLQPGGKATITFVAFCLDFGMKFPAGLQSPNDLADAKVQAALAHAQSKGYAANEQQALEVQNAI